MNKSFAAFQQFRKKLRPAKAAMAGSSNMTHWILRSNNAFVKVIFRESGLVQVHWDLSRVDETITPGVVKMQSYIDFRLIDEQAMDALVSFVRPLHDAVVADRTAALEQQAVQITRDLIFRLTGKL